MWRLVGINTFGVLVFLLVGGYYMQANLRQTMMTELSRDLQMRATLAQNVASNHDASDQDLVRELSHLSGARITLFDRQGKPLADSENHLDELSWNVERPEVDEALEHGSGAATRPDGDNDTEYHFVAVTKADDAKSPVIRLGITTRVVSNRLSVVRTTIFLTMGGLLLVGFLLSLLAARFVVKPVQTIKAAAEEVSKGRLDTTVDLDRNDELGSLGAAFNAMMHEFRDRVFELEAARRETAAIMDNMAEGLLLVDSNGVVEMANRAAVRMLAQSRSELVGRALWESVRLAEVDELLNSLPTLDDARRIWVEDHSRGPQRRVLEFVATPLFDTGDGKTHAVLLVSDATEDQKLLEMRQEFVANVSHELKTPLTSISAYCETLLDGALDDDKVRLSFLEKIQTNAERLTALVTDILNVSRLESGTSDESRERLDLREIVTSLARKHREAAGRKQILLTIEADDSPVYGLVNEEDITEAVDNLLGNAIGYTPEGGAVQIAVHKRENQIVIRVTDTGTGIPEDALPRIFERFYRVDKARSRAVGGTGLGLAIVKHVAMKHGGKVEAESELNKGSTFRIVLPSAQN